MCGIIAVLGKGGVVTTDLRKKFLRLSKKQRHRGPDWTGICFQEYLSKNGSPMLNILCHERLAIVDPGTGAQPLYNETGSVALTINGEIYNHQMLRKQFKVEHSFKTNSDCEPIVYLYEEFGDDFLHMLDGDFAFVISDKENQTFLAARDPIGVNPLYMGWSHDGSLWFSSEMKCLSEECDRFQEFPPGHYWSSKFGELRRYYNPKWLDEHIPDSPCISKDLVSILDRAIVKRLMTDVPYGVLLSGGLDSSLIASLVSRHTAMRVEEDEKKKPAWWPRLHSFSIGLQGAPDLIAAKKVADFLGTAHHEFNFTVQEGIDALSDVIYHLETFDVTTVRAATPMYFLTRKIRAMGVKMVLSGEGSDEIFGGYLYFHKAPSPEKFHVELCHKVKALSKYDCLRANKATTAWGVEVRVPFLDRDVLDFVMSINPSEKMIKKEEGKIEKYILRKAFDNKEKPWLPDDILWRQKEQFSDGVGYSWIDGLRAHAEKEISDEQFKMASYRFPNNTPKTKEA